MSMAADATAEGAPAEGAAKSGGRRKLILLAMPVLLGGVGAGLWFTGVIPKLLGRDLAGPGDSHASAGDAAPDTNAAPIFVEMPEIIANLTGGGRKAVYVKLRAQLEVGSSADASRINAAMPRLQDMFQTYIREMRPEELRGSSGTYRLREELIARAQIAAAPARVRDVLFVEVLIQ